MLTTVLKKLKKSKTITNFKVKIVNHESDTLCISFGIHSSREIQLRKLIASAFDNYHTIPSICEEVVKKCKNINEIVICSMWIQKIKESENINYPIIIEKNQT